MNPQPKEKPIRLYGKAKQKFREDVCARSMSRCDNCHLFAPLKEGESGFNLYRSGHVAHIKSYGSGGGDTMDNVGWLCYRCHILGEHGTRWSRGDP